MSEKDHRTDVGYSNDIQKRLKEHNAGRVAATKHRKPFRVLFTEEFSTIKEAKERELWRESSSGRRKLKKNFANKF